MHNMLYLHEVEKFVYVRGSFDLLSPLVLHRVTRDDYASYRHLSDSDCISGSTSWYNPTYLLSPT